MKTFKLLLPVVLAILGITSTGCKKIAAQLANVPNFALADSLYNGQELKIQRIRVYTYGFESDSPYVTLTNRSGKDWYASFLFDENAQPGPVDVTITAHNLDKTVDDEGQPADYKMSKTCKLFAWKLTTVAVSEGDYAGCTLVRMTGIGDDSEFFVGDTSDKIYTSWNSKGKLTWEAGNNLTIVKQENCDCYVRKQDVSATAGIRAKLNGTIKTLEF